MKIKNLYFAAALMTFAGCTSDDNSGAEMLPEGKYPLEIEATGLTATRSTRATVDGNWDGVEKVAVMVGDVMKLYTVSTDGETTGANAKLSSATDPFYWTSKADIKVSAWWPYTEGSTTMPEVKVKADQSTAADFAASDFIEAKEQPVSFATPKLSFTHRTAKVRVTLKDAAGSAMTEAATVKVCIGSDAAGITSYKNGTNEYLALVAPTSADASLAVNIVQDGATYVYNASTKYTFEAGKQYSFALKVSKQGVELDGCTIGGWEDAGDVVEGDAEEAGYTIAEDGVWHITTAEGLKAWAAEKAANGWKRCNAVLENDIVMPAPAAGESNWTPVENYDGVFDGNGKTISGLVIRGATTDNQGFFANIVGNSDEIGVVKNLTLKNVTIESTASYVGGIAGDCCGNIYGCHVTGTLKGNNMVGGLTGLYAPANYAALYACSAQCDVSGYSSVGGLMGYAQQGAALACWADCVMTSTDDPDDFECGYLAGSMGSDFVFSACYWTGTGVDNPVGWTRLADGSYAYPTAGTTKVDGTSRTWANATSDMNRELATNTNVSSDFTYRWYQATGSESNPPVLKK